MADCKDIDTALSRLSSKIDGLNNKLNNLENKQRECCEKKQKEEKPKDDKPPDLADIKRRLNELEKVQEALKIGIVETLNNFAHIESVNKDFSVAFQGVYELINPVIESVSLVVEFLKK